MDVASGFSIARCASARTKPVYRLRRQQLIVDETDFHLRRNQQAIATVREGNDSPEDSILAYYWVSTLAPGYPRWSYPYFAQTSASKWDLLILDRAETTEFVEIRSQMHDVVNA